MRILNESKSYATQAAAIRKLEREFSKEQFDNIRWFVTVTSDGRFVPTMPLSTCTAYDFNIGDICARGIAVIA